MTYDNASHFIAHMDFFSDGTNILRSKRLIAKLMNSKNRSHPDEATLRRNHIKSADGVLSSKSAPSTKISVRRVRPEAHGWVIASQVFRDDLCEIAKPIWMAFASKCVFREFDGKEIEPCISLSSFQKS